MNLLINSLHLILYLLFFLSFIILGLCIRIKSNTWDFFGSTPIDKKWFLLGKIMMFSSWIAVITQALVVNLRWIEIPNQILWIGLFFSIIGILFTLASFVEMGEDVRFGLLKDPKELSTDGIYSISRHPSYFGFYLMMIDSVVFTASPVILLMVIIAIIIHHRIAIAEETFLLKEFGQTYQEYTQKVNRYFIWF